jgi:cytochrome c-type biogenesis protein CcmH
VTVFAFAIACAVTLAVVLGWITMPLWRRTAIEPASAVEEAANVRERRWATGMVALLVPAIAVGMYVSLSNWDWDPANRERTANSGEMNVEEMLKQLEKKLESDPKNVDGWLMLGRSYTQLGRFARAVDAYQHAYDLTKGENVNAISGLGEALTLVDQASLAGRAGELFEAALSKDPNDLRSLWYGGMAALQAGKLRVGRDRFQLLLQSEEVPQDMRTMLQGKVEELNSTLGEHQPTAGGAVPNSPPTAVPASDGPATQAEAANPQQQRMIKLVIKIAPEIKQQLSAPLPLFVLAREPGGGGPPLAVQRHSSAELPLTMTLSESDSMIPSRTIANVPRVQIVARLSRSGGPQARSGDFFGEASYEFGKNTGAVQITIDQRVP